MSSEIKSLQRNIRFLYALDFFANSAFTGSIYMLFGTLYLGLNYFQAGSFFIAGWFVSIFLDFLGGTVADAIGRKQAYLYGVAIQAAAVVPFLVTKSYPLLLLSSVVGGIGIALSSSSIDALIYEQASSLGEKAKYQHANATTQVFAFVGRVYACLLGGLVFQIEPRLPYLLYFVALVLAVVAGARIKVTARINPEGRPAYLENVKAALRVYRQHRALVKFLVIGCLFGLLGDMLFGYIQPYFIQQHATSFELGALFSVISIASAAGSYIMRTLTNKVSAHAIQSLELVGVLATSLLLIVLRMPAAFAAPIFAGIVFGLTYPNLRLYVNSHATDSARASVLSFASTVFNVGTGIGFVVSFYLSDRLQSRIILSAIIVGTLLTLVVNQFWHPAPAVSRQPVPTF